MTSEWVSQSEVARLFGCSRQNVQQRMTKGSIPWEVVDGKPMVPRSYVEATLAMRNRDKKKEVV